MKRIIYMDAAASSLKFEDVIKTQTEFLEKHYANAGRGVCANSIFVDNMINETRNNVAKFIGAKSSNIVFTSGTTDGINRIARILINDINQKPAVVVSDLDHHSARLAWEVMARENKCNLNIADLDSEYNISLDNITDMDILILTAMSNVMGAPQNLKKIISDARKINPNVIVVIDAAQYVVHNKIDVSQIDCDFLCFSGHKMGADTGIGVMYIKDTDKWSPDNLGGGMVITIDEKDYTYATGPHKFEAGTLPLTQIAGLNAAISNMDKWENTKLIIEKLYNELSKIDGVKILTKPESNLISFVVDGIHCLDFGAYVGASGLCLRIGNMCASWIHKLLNLPGTIRLSPGWWNTDADISEAVQIIKKAIEVNK